ncbi:hypothetical protein [Gulosibacter molinativorax]|uniref:Uncharacterized protein n=1 Tax=Gulosibacter molinativorax TaxID=256821 RepID=A0ABT7CBS9_9MICO|nr:hypothetical protein [Gulosibacter molinativorax]MDJ1372656.1 hypothetical protein [Gulosibacter molinativorax]QUY62390.1 Hypotetical protein [Gulosibacter molinativorax]
MSIEITSVTGFVPDDIVRILPLQRALTDPCWLREIQYGFAKHGHAFLGFLHNPTVTELPYEELLSVFERAHLLTEKDEQSAIDAMVVRQGWNSIRENADVMLGHEGLLRWDRERLREVLRERYIFTTFQGECSVFDWQEIMPHEES